MRLDDLEEHLGRLFGNSDGAAPAMDAADRAELAARLAVADRVGPAAPSDACERLAAFLDGVLEGEERRSFEADLAHFPGEREELEATRHFLDRVAQKSAAAPQDLLEAALGRLQELPQSGTRRGPVEEQVRRFWRSRIYGVIGAGACLALAVISVAPILNEGAGKPTQMASPASSGPARASSMTGGTAIAPRYIRQPAALPQALPQEASRLTPDMRAKLGVSNSSPAQENIARAPQVPSGMNVADNNCPTLTGSEIPTFRTGKAPQGRKFSRDSAAAQDCSSDVMVGAQYPGMGGPIAPAPLRSLGAVGTGAPPPLPGHFQD